MLADTNSFLICVYPRSSAANQLKMADTDPNFNRPAGRAIFQQCDRTSPAPYSRNEYLARLAWNVVQATLFRYSPSRAHGFRRWLLKLFGAKIGPKSFVRREAKVFHPWLLEIGEWSAVAQGVTLYNLGPLKIGDHTVLSQDVYVCGGSHDYTRSDLPLIRPTNIIGSGVWIAAGAFIGPGTTVGDNSVVAARAVVVKDVPAGMVVGGNPAKVIKPRPMND